VRSISTVFATQRNLSDTRQRLLEKKFVNSIVDFWKKNVISELKSIRDVSTLNQAIKDISENIGTELGNRITSHIKKILQLGLIEGFDSPIRIPKEILDNAFQEFLHNSILSEVVGKVEERMKQRLLELDGVGSTDMTSLDPNVIEEQLKKIAYEELNSVKTAIRSETQYAVGVGRELAWSQRDPSGEFRYRWGTGRDSRVTDCCNEIAGTVSEEGNGQGVSLRRLKEIVRYFGSKYYPEFRQRDFNPHYGCRSGAERVV